MKVQDDALLIIFLTFSSDIVRIKVLYLKLSNFSQEFVWPAVDDVASVAV